MEVFISWSGQLSKDIGEVFRKWIPGVLQAVKPYFTPDDVEKGARWNSEISKELERSQIGIMILTRENLSSSWLMFEAGALSKQMDKSHICPILYGIENTDLQGPLVQFQTTSFNQDDIRKLIKSINSACGEQKLEEGVLDQVYEMWWPKLEKDIAEILAKHKEKSKEKPRSEREIIEEILALTRLTADRSRRDIGVESDRIPPGAYDDLFEYYLQLKHAADTGDADELELILHKLEKPIRYIAMRTGRRAMLSKIRTTPPIVGVPVEPDLFEPKEKGKE
jgi:hypothetical protein